MRFLRLDKEKRLDTVLYQTYCFLMTNVYNFDTKRSVWPCNRSE